MMPVERHKKSVLQFSGGKDSLACLHLLRPFLDRITVLWVNSGAAFPETLYQMSKVREMVPNFVEVHGNQPAQIAKYGPPSDVVPVRSSRLGRIVMSSSEPPVQSALDCCAESILIPMNDTVKTLGATLVIRGQKNSDADKACVKSGHVNDGIEYWFPLEAWTDDDVLAYLKESGVELPEHYAYVNSSLDCWNCTAYRGHVVGRMKYMKERHPELHKRVLPMLQQIKTAVSKELAYVDEALNG